MYGVRFARITRRLPLGGVVQIAGSLSAHRRKVSGLTPTSFAAWAKVNVRGSIGRMASSEAAARAVLSLLSFIGLGRFVKQNSFIILPIALKLGGLWYFA